mmetsp:Transcript_124163/g.201858  ORF Transcript_124163/g.201858 Transcript_124163/m.201858 type:complete len:294 (-) Transcript_124163:32-913(-)
MLSWLTPASCQPCCQSDDHSLEVVGVEPGKCLSEEVPLQIDVSRSELRQCNSTYARSQQMAPSSTLLGQHAGDEVAPEDPDDDPNLGGVPSLLGEKGSLMKPVAGRLMYLCLAPDQDAQQILAAAADGAGAKWVRRYGGYHVLLGRPLLADTVDGFRALAAVAGDGVAYTKSFPWDFGRQAYSLRQHKCGVSLPCFCQDFLKLITENESIWFPSAELGRAAERARQAGWSRVESRDFHLTVGPREEVRHVLSEIIACLWEARWVWVLGMETEAGSGTFKLDWNSARPALSFMT